MNRDIQEIREAMHRRRIDQTAMAKLLEKVSGKKVGRAAVSRQLSQPKMSKAKVLEYWEALGGREQEREPVPPPATNPLAEAMRFLMMCSREDLERAQRMISATLESEPHRR